MVRIVVISIVGSYIDARMCLRPDHQADHRWLVTARMLLEDYKGFGITAYPVIIHYQY